MKEMTNDPQLEQRLQRHYQTHYGSPPDPVTMWERLAPRLDGREQSAPW